MTGAEWWCASVQPGEVSTPAELAKWDLNWIPAVVPGTVAQALRNAGYSRPDEGDQDTLDGRDWWFRTDFPGPQHDAAAEALLGEPFNLQLDGLATLSDVWLNDEHLLHTDNMYESHEVSGLHLLPANELRFRFASLDAALARPHPRPRWKSRLVRSQSSRWYRTTLLGRIPGWSSWAAPVGPWRAVSLTPTPKGVRLIDHRVMATCQAAGGSVSVKVSFLCPHGIPATVRLCVGDASGQLETEVVDGATVEAHGVLQLEQVDRWWPHTHGEQRLYPVTVSVDGEDLELGKVGFREIDLDQEGGGFQLVFNGVPIFCRGACWTAPDTVSFASPESAVREALVRARAAGMNMLRVPGYTTYQDSAFWDVCDELGILVWQDCMFASVDPPESPDFIAAVERELAGVFRSLQGRPALAMVCGSSETHQQGAMFGLPVDGLANVLLDQRIPSVVADFLPGVPYVASSPTGGDLPFEPDVGVCHYFGVGAYLLPLSDVRSAGVRFAAECLGFAIPPERETVQRHFSGGARNAGHHPTWKQTVARDGGTSWDFEDIRDHYVSEIFRVDPLRVRYAEPELALDYGRAAVLEAAQYVLSFWRTAQSTCAGALILTWRDQWPGAGWGLLDASGHPKAPLYLLPRVFGATALFFSNDGLAGLRLHLANDPDCELRGTVRITLYSAQGLVTESVERAVNIAPRTVQRFSVTRLLDGFRDLTQVYRFGAPEQDVVRAQFLDSAGDATLDVCFLPGGPARPRLPDVGLRATVQRDTDGQWWVTVTTRLFAQWVALDVPGYEPSDSWFHLAPGASHCLSLTPTTGEARAPYGTVRSLNSLREVSLEIRNHEISSS